MKTYLLPWNPDYSQYKMSDFESDFRHLEFGDFNWTLSENSSVRSGDNFFMVKYGGGREGLVMKGFFITEPSQDDELCSIQLRPSTMLHPANGVAFVTLEQLSATLASKNITEHPHEILLARDEAKAVEELWEQCMNHFSEEDFNSSFLQKDCRPDAEVDDAICMVSEALYDMKDEAGEALVIRSLRKALACRNKIEMISSLLQDILSVDDSFSIGMIREKGFREDIADRLQSETVRFKA